MFGFGNQQGNNSSAAGGFGAPTPPFGSGGGGTGSGFPSAFGPTTPNIPSGFAAAPAGFGNSNSQGFTGNVMFGSSPNVNATTTTAAPASGTSGFASHYQGTGMVFGQSPSLSSAAPSTAGFGSSNTINPTFGSTPFGNTPPFASPAQQAPPAAMIPFAPATPFNPFAPSQPQVQPSSSQPVSFGLSSNVVTKQARPWSGTQMTSGQSGNASNVPTPATPAWGTSSPFGQQPPPSSVAYDDGMMDDAPPPSNLPFGSPVESSSSNNMDSFFGSETGADDSTEPQGNNNDALLKLQARIEAKKKKFEQKQLREAAAAASSSLRVEAPSFQPSSAVSTAPLDVESVAQRNAVRFADSTDATTRSHLPQDLLSQSAEVTAAQTALRNSGGRSGRENLENAVSLIGTCEHMCPDEELLRREREGDIQLLERCAPGVLHPASWTLRNTMVKRFRRSAADYKLDVPEWVRPPDVLEKVCGYLEEWVMVRILEIH
jgi:SAC3/GANP family